MTDFIFAANLRVVDSSVYPIQFAAHVRKV